MRKQYYLISFKTPSFCGKFLAIAFNKNDAVSMVKNELNIISNGERFEIDENVENLYLTPENNNETCILYVHRYSLFEKIKNLFT